jgi:hypothetical protein
MDEGKVRDPDAISLPDAAGDRQLSELTITQWKESKGTHLRRKGTCQKADCSTIIKADPRPLIYYY